MGRNDGKIVNVPRYKVGCSPLDGEFSSMSGPMGSGGASDMPPSLSLPLSGAPMRIPPTGLLGSGGCSSECDWGSSGVWGSAGGGAGGGTGLRSAGLTSNLGRYCSSLSAHAW